LHPELITKTYNELEKGAGEGYGDDWFKVDAAHGSTAQLLKQNIYKFSGAKTYQQLAEMNSFLVDDKGKIRSYSEFKRKVDVVHESYNRNYLQAEYQTAKRSAQAARQWKGYEENKDLFPNLKYMTVGDDKVRHDHEKLHGIIKPVNDVFWDTHYPPNGWRCRCYVRPTSEGETSTKVETDPDKGFGINVGKVSQVFDENSHPYFAYPSGDAKDVKKAFENFKAIAPYGKARFIADNGSKVFVSPFANASPGNLIGNYRVAIKIAEQLKYDVKLRPFLDEKILIGQTNQEYLIKGKLAERKSPTDLKLKSIFSEAIKNKSEVVVIDLENSGYSIDEIKQSLKGIFYGKSNTVSEVIVVSKNRKTMVSYQINELQ